MIKDIDPLLNDTPEQEQQTVLDDVYVEDMLPDTASIDEVPFGESPETESVEVAAFGLGPLKETLKKSAKRTADNPDLRKGKEPDYIDTDIQENLDAYKQATGAAPIEGKPPELTVNLNQIKGTDEFKQHIETFASRVADKPERMDFKSLAKEMRDEGYSDAFVSKVINTNSKLAADPKEVFKMRYAHADASARTYDEVNLLLNAIDDGSATPEMYLRVKQAANMEGLITKGMLGKRADVARAMRAFGEVAEAQADRGPMIDNLLNSVGGMDDIEQFAKAYKTANKTTRAKMTERGIGSTVKDVWMTTWINGLLSSPVTHVKNITANAGYVGLSIAEKQTAALIGKTRNLLFNSQDYIRQQEVLVDMYSLNRGIQEGFALGKEAWKNNRQVTGRSKVEVRTSSDPFDVKIPEDATPFQRMMGKTWGLYGKYVTLPGRALMSADEFFKGINYRRHLDSVGVREFFRVRDEAVKAGDDIVAAEKKGQEAMLKVLDDPDDAIHNEAIGFAEEMTFTGKLEGGLGYMEKLAQNPVAKVFVPFIRTPTNIAIELNKRLPTPGLLVSKKVREDWAAGGIRRDMVMARVGLSSASMYAVSNLGLDGKITGAGPFSDKQKAGLKAIGWQPYSFVFDKDKVSDEQLAEFKKYTTVTSGNDKVFVSYAGLEPIGALVGIGATMGEYSIFEPSSEAMEQIFMGASLGLADYISELPMISGVSEMMQVFRGGGSEGVDYAVDMFKRVNEQAGDFLLGGSPIGALNSLVAYTDRALNPEKRMPQADVEGLDDYGPVLSPVFKGFLNSLASYKSRNPFLSKDMPPVFDPITGEQLESPTSAAWMRMFPFRMSEQKYSPAYDVLNAHEIGQYKPARKINGIELTPSQRNRWIELATNTPDRYGVLLEDAIVNVMNDKNYIKLMTEDKEKAKAYITGIISDYYSDAKKQLLMEELDLSDSIEYKKIQRSEGIETKIEAMLQ